MTVSSELILPVVPAVPIEHQCGEINYHCTCWAAPDQEFVSCFRPKNHPLPHIGGVYIRRGVGAPSERDTYRLLVVWPISE